MRRRVAAASLAVLTVLSTVGAAAQASADHSRTGHDRVIDYWSPERMAAAQPRDLATSTGHAAAKGNGRDRAVKGVWNDADARVAEVTGKVFFLLDGDPYTCSATAVEGGDEDVDLVLTAGHCLWDRTASHPSGQFAEFFLYVPGYQGGGVPVLSGPDTGYDGWVAEQLFVARGWQEGDYGDDTGVAVVTNALDAEWTFADAFPRLPSVALPSLAVASPGDTVSAFGYPGGRNYKGNQLGFCQGPLERPAAEPGSLALRCQLSGGASGGAWYSGVGGTGEIISVSSNERRGDNRIFGPAFDAAEAELFRAAADGACDAQELCASTAPRPPLP